jgi:hypothetical protein
MDLVLKIDSTNPKECKFTTVFSNDKLQLSLMFQHFWNQDDSYNGENLINMVVSLFL